MGAFLARKKKILEIWGDWFTVTDLRKPALGFLTKFLTKLLLVLACHLSDYVIVRNYKMKKKFSKATMRKRKLLSER